MSVRRFAVELERPPSDAQLGDLFARCDDLCVESGPHRPSARVAVDRPAPTLVDAIVSVIRDLDAVGLVALRVCADDDLVAIEVVDPEPAFAAVNLGLALRAMSPTVERMAAIRALLAG